MFHVYSASRVNISNMRRPRRRRLQPLVEVFRQPIPPCPTASVWDPCGENPGRRGCSGRWPLRDIPCWRSLFPRHRITPKMERPFKKVIIVGAGPAGLLLALMLSQRGIPVQVLEAEDKLDGQPRAAHYGAPALPDLDRAGVLAEIKRRGIIITDINYRYAVPDGSGFERLATIDGNAVRDVGGFDYRSHCLALHDLCALMLELFVGRHGGEVGWRHRVVRVEQDAGGAWVDVETPEGPKRIGGDYVVGCDGAGSQVRRSLFGSDFPGFTWEKQIVATNTYYDFDRHDFGDVTINVHPENFYLAAKLDNKGLYRITYGEKVGLTTEEMRARLAARFEEILPGHPKPDQYKVINFSPYKMHQRCAPSFRVGRVLLVADAAHLCNPWGGMGITGGFVDVGGLDQCLGGIWDGLADDAILDLYSEKRIDKYRTVIDELSTSNFRRIAYTDDPASLAGSDEFVGLLRKGEADEGLMREVLLGGLDMRYDFSQHFKGK
ncbi:hypothetical protein RB601_008122 [Gaeumannomyces tritici]